MSEKRMLNSDVAEELLNLSYGSPGETTEDEAWRFVTTQGRGARRWSEQITVVFQDVSDETFWGFTYDRGLTEMQENAYPWDAPYGKDRPTEIAIHQLYPHEKTTTEYGAVPPKLRPGNLGVIPAQSGHGDVHHLIVCRVNGDSATVDDLRWVTKKITGRDLKDDEISFDWFAEEDR